MIPLRYASMALSCVLWFASSASAQIEINIERPGAAIDVQIYVDTDDTVTVEEDWLGIDIIDPIQLPD